METSKIFDNADFGYTRVTVERPLRLRFHIDEARKERFLEKYPLCFEDLDAIDMTLGRQTYFDWNAVSDYVQSLLKEREARWRAPHEKLFREIFTERDPKAAPVITRREPLKSGHQVSDIDRFNGWFTALEPLEKLPPPSGVAMFAKPAHPERVQFEPDSELRDFENIPLKEDINEYFRREVQPYVLDAWMDREKDKIGYEINFNRYFYKYIPPRSLEEIDADLQAAENEILRLLGEVTT